MTGALQEWASIDREKYVADHGEEAFRALLNLWAGLKVRAASEHLADFIEWMMPDPDRPDDARFSEFRRAPHAMLMCDLVEKTEKGEHRKSAVSIAPQHGKTTIISKLGVAWMWARNPRLKLIVVGYNQDRAEHYGAEIREVLQSERFAEVFPKFKLKSDSKSKSYLKNEDGGAIVFRGAGAGITGFTGDIIVIDDPFKGVDDEFTPEALEKLWEWFFKVAVSRANKKTRVFVVHTRWVEDDLIGRLCDPEHPERDKKYKGIADSWFFLNLPGVITQPELADMLGLDLDIPLSPSVLEAFGVKPMACLWDDASKDSKSLEMYADWKRGNPRSFSALVQGKPTPDDGLFFKANWVLEYDMPDLPHDLRYYAASDHAVSEKTANDFTVMGVVGIDVYDNIWVMPDLVFERMESDRAVEEIIRLMRKYDPDLWFMESELISKSFGPFLRKRMHETETYNAIIPVTPSKDKRTRAQAIRGRMSMGKVRFPREAFWWRDAKNQLLRFPYATNDDFVDWLSHIGMGMDLEVPAQAPRKTEGNVVKVGSWEWITGAAAARERREASGKGGW